MGSPHRKRFNNTNQMLGQMRTGRETGTCQVCGRTIPHRELDWQRAVHQGAQVLQCVNKSHCQEALKYPGWNPSA